MNVRLVVAELLAFSAIVGVHAAEPETIGLWVFDGTPGAAVAADQVTIPNAIPGKAPVLTLDVHKAEVPRPTYSDQKMGAYLFNGKDYKSYITNLTGSIRLQKRYGQNTLSWTDRHAYIAVSNALELAGSDFTVEFIYRIGSQPPNPWPGWTYFYNLPDVNSWHINGFNTVRDQTTNVILNDNNTSAGIADNDWHHFAAVWTESDKTAQVYFDYSATGVVPMTKTAYAITNAAQMVARIFYGGGSMYYFGDAYVQAVRLTKGALTCDDFMAVKNEPQTGAFSAYHWTFDNTADGTPFKYCPMEGTGRLDYKLFKQTARTSAQTITGSVDVIKACVKDKTSAFARTRRRSSPMTTSRQRAMAISACRFTAI